MPYAEVPAFMARLKGTVGVASLALQFTILTACRTSEVLGTIFDEVDFEQAILSKPPAKMKTDEAFSVPLSDRAIDILRAQEALRGRNPHVFPGRPTKPLSNMALAMLLRRLGVDVTVHGFRTSFRTWCSDVAHAEFEIAEMCLSHRVGSAVSRAYNRTTTSSRCLRAGPI
jgi:integrase